MQNKEGNRNVRGDPLKMPSGARFACGAGHNAPGMQRLPVVDCTGRCRL